MNEGEALALGRRAKRCSQWRWAPGMCTVARARITEATTNGRILAAAKGYMGAWYASTLAAEEVPDFRDPATLGCLLALVRDAQGDSSLCAVSYRERDRVMWRIDAQETNEPLSDIPNLYDLDSEAEALVRALEDASLRADAEEEDDR